AIQPRRHVVGDHLTERGRALANVQHQVDHPPRYGAYQLPHVRVPLEMHAAHGSSTRITLVGLDERDVTQAGEPLVTCEVALAEMLGEETSVVQEPRELDHPDLRYGQAEHIKDLQRLTSCA